MTANQIAVFSGVLLFTAIALILFLGYLWQQRTTQSQEYYLEQEDDNSTEQNANAFDDTATINQNIAPNSGTQSSDTLNSNVNNYDSINYDSINYDALNEDTAEVATESMSITDLKVKSKLYHYIAHVTKVYDGDTITVDIDMGMGVWQHGVQIRLWRINTSEVRGSEREQGLITRDFMRSLILDRDILLRTILDKRGQDRTGKYGRLLGEVLVEDNSGRMLNVNQLLLDKGLAQPVGSDGSMPVPAAAPAPLPSLESAGSVIPQVAEYIACIYCGEVRAVDRASNQIAPCTNCFDEAYPL